MTELSLLLLYRQRVGQCHIGEVLAGQCNYPPCETFEEFLEEIGVSKEEYEQLKK